MKHHFKKTKRLLKGKVVWLCERCQSECVFKPGTTELEANQFIEVAYPKMVCMQIN